MLRKAYVAGQFYPAKSSNLKKQLESLTDKNAKKQSALGLVVPHAGYIYSGTVAGACFSQSKLTDSIIILGPNHTGEGALFSIMSRGSWETPLGEVEIDQGLATDILSNSKYLQEDTAAHLYEHSIEVQLPFLQFLASSVRIVPVALSLGDFTRYNEIGQAIAKAIKKTKQNCLIVASSDMTHYKSQEKAKENDNLAIESILKLNGKDLLKKIEQFNITMCGAGPVISMLSAVKSLGAKTAALIKYQTSAKVSGDFSSVVGYAGIMVKKS